VPDPAILVGIGSPEGILYENPQQQIAYLDRVQAGGGNACYAIIVRCSALGGDDKTNTQSPFQIPTNPSSGLSNARLDAIDAFLSAAGTRGIHVLLFMYDDSALPFGGKGQNAIPSGEAEFFRAIVNRFESHANLIWCIAEEYKEVLTNARASALAAVIRNADDHDHLITVHGLTGRLEFDLNGDPNIDIHTVQSDATSAQAMYTQLATADANATDRPVLMGENYHVDATERIKTHSLLLRDGRLDDIRRYNWSAAMAGAGSLVIGPWESTSNNTNPVDSFFTDMGVLRQFFESTKLWTMRRDQARAGAGTDYVLANVDGTACILYDSGNASALTYKGLPAGTYALRWLDPVDGHTVSATHVQAAAGDATFPVPATIGQECVVWVNSAQTIQWSTSGVSVTEGTASVTLTLTRSGGSAGAASVAWATANGTATQGSDYTSASGTVSWAAGDAANKTVVIALLDDAVVEGSETFVVNLSNAAGAALGTTTAATVTIADNEVAVNQAPVAQNQAISAVSGMGVSISLLMADADGPGPYSYTITAQPTHGTLVGSAGNNDWTYTPTAGYVGSDTFSWKVNDGSLTSNVAVCSLTVSAASPATPTIPSALNDHSTTPTFSGTVGAGQTVHVFVDGVEIGTAVANGSGAWSFTPGTPLSQGSHSITLTASVGSGTPSSASPALTILVDTIAPLQPSAPTLGGTAIAPVVSGVTSETGGSVRILVDGTVAATVAVGAGGAWSYPVTATAGTHQVTVQILDAAGNPSTVSSATPVTLAASTGGSISVATNGGGGCGAGGLAGLLLGCGLVVASLRQCGFGAGPLAD